MTSNVYECLFILDSNRYARDPQAVAQGISDMVTSNDGEILVTRLWNEQKLAYPINGNRKRTYWLTYFSMEGTSLSSIERSSSLNDNVKRNLTIKVDPRLVDTLVSHAKGIAAAKETKSTEAPAAETKAPAADEAAEAPKAEAAATETAETTETTDASSEE